MNMIFGRRELLLWLTIGVTTFLFVNTCFGQYRTIVLSDRNTNYPSATNIIVGPNKVVEFLGGSYYQPAASSSIYADVDIRIVMPDSPGSTNFTKVDVGGSTDWAVKFEMDVIKPYIRVIEGSVLIDASMKGGTGFFTIKITDQSPTMTPNTAVVIPSDAQGPVNIVMESSTNLVDWNGALPGTYGATAAQRYFRLRAVGQ